MIARVLDCSLPTVPCSVRAEVRGLDAEVDAVASARWPELARTPDAFIAITIVDRAPGFPPERTVRIDATWDGERCSLRGGGLEASIDFSASPPRGTAEVGRARAFGGLESVMRAVAVLVLQRRAMIVVHASAVCRDQSTVLFLGASGAGKTTTARRLAQEGFARICDDLVAVDLSPNARFRVHPIPFERRGELLKAGLSPTFLKAAALVRRGADELHAALVPASSAEALHAWAEAAVLLPEVAPRSLVDAIAALSRVPLFELFAPRNGPLAPAVESMLATSTVRAGRPTPPVAPSAAVSSASDNAATTLVRREPNVAWRVLDGAAVLIAPRSPKIETLNPVGTRIWELADGRPLEAIVEAIVNEFEVARTEAQHDVEHFVQDLSARGLLHVGER